MINRNAAVVAFLLLTACAVVSGQALAPGPSLPSDDCFTKVLNMSDCLSYVTTGSNVTKPDKPCCPELAGLVESNPICLCELLGKSNSYGVSIDLNRAVKLPSVCGVKTPPIDLCSGGPTASKGPGVQPPTGLAASPSAGNNGSGASSNAASVMVGLALVLAFGYLI